MSDSLEFVDEFDDVLTSSEVENFSQAVLYASDWTVETVLSQLERKNIDLNPRFQRRDAWTNRGKSQFIESIIIGLPIPQIVLAEKKGKKGQFIVLDGKQRLLSLLQFSGKAAGLGNSFGLSGLEARTDLTRKKFHHLKNNAEYNDDLNAFLNHTMRTVVIRNWPNTEFLHLVFLRLNTGSVKLSPQELRQAMVPGDFSDYIDDKAIASAEIKRLLSRKTPDPRMRDVELLVRFLSFNLYLRDYSGRMKLFLDETCRKLNSDWSEMHAVVSGRVDAFENGITCLLNIFGEEQLARKENSKSFNRAIFDTLIFYAVNEKIQTKMLEKPDNVILNYRQVLQNPIFAEAIESDTAGIPHTFDRLKIWGESLSHAIGMNFPIPYLVPSGTLGNSRINFTGFE